MTGSARDALIPYFINLNMYSRPHLSISRIRRQLQLVPWHDANGSVLFMKYYTIPNTVLVMVLVIMYQVEGKNIQSPEKSKNSEISFIFKGG